MSKLCQLYISTTIKKKIEEQQIARFFVRNQFNRKNRSEERKLIDWLNRLNRILLSPLLFSLLLVVNICIKFTYIHIKYKIHNDKSRKINILNCDKTTTSAAAVEAIWFNGLMCNVCRGTGNKIEINKITSN